MDPGTNSPSPRARSGAPLPEDLRNELRDMVARLGERSTCERTGLSATTIARALAGFGINRGTVAMIRAALVAP